jgi:hypothetical protein
MGNKDGGVIMNRNPKADEQSRTIDGECLRVQARPDRP